MKMKNYLALAISSIGILSCSAQCRVTLGADIALTCGNSVQLSSDPVWTAVNDFGPAPAEDVFFFDATVGYNVGTRGTIRKTIDGGNTWVNQISNTNNTLRSVFFTDADNGIIVGADGIILRTTNGGTNWNIQVSGTTAFLISVFFTDANTGIAVGDGGTILKTTDAGINWIKKVSNSTGTLGAVHFPDKNTGYVTSEDKMLKTIDGGENWMKLSISGSSTGIYFTDVNIGYMGGSGVIYKTIDGGNSWNSTSINTTDGVGTIYFTDMNTGYAGSVGKIYKTTDGGITWKSQGVNFMGISSIHFPDSKTGYAVGFNPTMPGVTQRWTLKYMVPDDITWTPSTGLSATNIANPIASPKVTTTYTVTTTAGSCVAVDSIKITVIPLEVNAGDDKTIICGGSIQLNDVTTTYTATSPLVYSWTPATGLDATNIAHPTVTIKQNMKYYVTVTTPNGCTATDSVSVLVEGLTAEAGLGKTLTCGGTAHLDAVTTNYTGTGTLTYSWLPVSGLNFSNIPDPISSTDKKTVYHVTVTTPNGCTAEDSVEVLVSPLIADAGSDKKHICGSGVQLDNVLSNYTGTAPLSYSWLPTTGLSNATISNPTSSADDITYTVTVTTSNGCQDMDEIQVGLTKMNAPEICMVGVDSTGKNVVMWNKFSATAIDSVYIYRETTISDNYIKIGSISSSKNTFRDISSQPEIKSNKYKISMLDSCGLETSQSASHKTMHLAITKGIGTSWNLIWEKYEGFTVPTYNIYRGTSKTDLQFLDAVSGGSNQFTNYNPPPGNLYYQVEVVNPSPCNTSGLTSSLRSNVATNSTSVGIAEEENGSFNFSVYPNPSAEFITITTVALDIKNTVITLYNTLGAAVKTVSVEQKNEEINISDLTNGFYMIELKSGSQFAKQRLIIQK